MPAQPLAVMPAQRTTSYDGQAPFAGGADPPATAAGWARAAVTAVLVVVPFGGLAAAIWLLRDDPTPPSRYAPDLMADTAMRAVPAAFPALCAASLVLPAGDLVSQ